MPHVIVKLYAGRTREDKARLADELAQAVMKTLGSKEASVSISIEDVKPADWAETVSRPDILGKPDTLYRKPGYNPFDKPDA